MNVVSMIPDSMLRASRATGCARSRISLRAPHCWCGYVLGALLLVMLPLTTGAQEKTGKTAADTDTSLEMELKLLERDPFFELTLDAANGNAVLEILPIENVPANPKPSAKLRIRLVSDPGQAYDVQWRHITKLRTYEEMVFDEARRLVAEKQFEEAYEYFDYLLRHTKVTPALKRAVLDYMLQDAAYRETQKDYLRALAILEEVTLRDSGHRAAEVATRIARVADSLIAAEVEQGNYRKARGMIARLEKQYGPKRIESLGRWRKQLIDEATRLKQQAEQAMAKQDYRTAERLSRQMIRIWPDLPGAEKLRAELARHYPMVIVGVAEVATTQNAIALSNWSARRTGRLTERTLVQFLGAGPEGGQYLCPLGDYYESDDRRRLTLQLAEVGAGQRVMQVDGYDVSQRVLAMANPTSPMYDPNWASLIKGTRVEDVFRVHIDLRRPYVLPEAMLQFRLDLQSNDPNLISPSDGPYLQSEVSDDDVHFVVNERFPFPGSDHPAEIVERHFATSADAIAALRRGDIDVIDYLFPDDAARLAGDKTLHVVPYALPTVHVLIPNYDNPLTANQTFRRALLYGINRQAILETELLGKRRVAGTQVISGPFPVGTSDNDPLAYAYDDRIAPRSYYPRLSLILKTLALRTLREIAKKRGEEMPTDVKLVIGYPPNQVARVACQAIAQYLQVVGIDCRLRELPPDANRKTMKNIDLLYMQVAMWEPMVDARRLLAPKGVAATGNEYVGMALRRLDAARNWREVRERLHELHRIVHEQVAVIPLWQTVDHLAHSRRLDRVGSAPLTLYESVEQWQFAPRDTVAKKKQAKR